MICVSCFMLTSVAVPLMTAGALRLGGGRWVLRRWTAVRRGMTAAATATERVTMGWHENAADRLADGCGGQLLSRSRAS